MLQNQMSKLDSPRLFAVCSQHTWSMDIGYIWNEIKMCCSQDLHMQGTPVMCGVAGWWQLSEGMFITGQYTTYQSQLLIIHCYPTIRNEYQTFVPVSAALSNMMRVRIPGSRSFTLATLLSPGVGLLARTLLSEECCLNECLWQVADVDLEKPTRKYL